MKRLFFLSMIVWLVSCVPVMSEKKAPGYQQTIEELTVVYVDKQQLEVTSGPYNYEGREMRFLSHKEFFEFPGLIQSEFPAVFAEKETKARVEIAREVPSEYNAFAARHVLIVEPRRVDLMFEASGSVIFAVTLIDTRDKVEVWSAEVILGAGVPDVYDAKAARSFATAIAARLERAGFLSN